MAKSKNELFDRMRYYKNKYLSHRLMGFDGFGWIGEGIMKKKSFTIYRAKYK
jgi:hypothetical protein